MGQLSEKELSMLNDSLNEEELLVKKYQQLAKQSKDPETCKQLEQISQKHQGHYNSLFSLLG